MSGSLHETLIDGEKYEVTYSTARMIKPYKYPTMIIRGIFQSRTLGSDEKYIIFQATPDSPEYKESESLYMFFQEEIIKVTHITEGPMTEADKLFILKSQLNSI